MMSMADLNEQFNDFCKPLMRELWLNVGRHLKPRMRYVPYHGCWQCTLSDGTEGQGRDQREAWNHAHALSKYRNEQAGQPGYKLLKP